MKRYILISNYQRDIEYQYADFGVEANMSVCFFKFNRTRVGVLRVLIQLRLTDNVITRVLYFNRIFKKEVDSCINRKAEEECVFIITARAYEKYGINLINHIRNNYRGSKLVLYLADLIHTMRFNLDDAKNDFDIVCSFDKREAAENDLHFVLEPFSTRLLDKLESNDEPVYDVTFVGGARDRYESIIRLYENLKEHGLKCDFNITEVEPQNQKYSDDIHYGWVNFDDVLKKVINSKCVIEILQKGAYSGTTRYAEAMLLGRNLLTNSDALKEEENSENNIFYLNEMDDINNTLFERITQKNTINVGRYRNKFSNREFINAIQEIISKNL